MTDQVEEATGSGYQGTTAGLSVERDLAHRQPEDLRLIIEDQQAHLTVLMARIETAGSDEEELRAMVAGQVDEQRRIIASRDEGIAWLRDELALARQGTAPIRHELELAHELCASLSAKPAPSRSP